MINTVPWTGLLVGGRRAWRAAAIGAVAAVAIGAPVARAQIFQRAIGNTPEEVSYSIEETRLDCGYVTAGECNGAAAGGVGNIHVTKYKYDGTVQWSRMMVIGAGVRSTAYSVRETAVTPAPGLPNGYFVGCESNALAGLGMHVIRLDLAGNPIWSNAYVGTPYLDFPAGVALREMPDDGAVVVGRIQPVVGGPTQGLLMRINAGGVPLFQRVYQVTNANSVSFTDIRVFPNGLLIVGTYLDPASGLQRAMLLQTDFNGNPLMFRGYTDGQNRIFGDGLDWDPATASIVWSGRRVGVTSGITDMLVVRTDAFFNPLWTDVAPRTTPGFAAVHWTLEPSIIACGTSVQLGGATTTALLARMNPAGGVTLARQYGGVAAGSMEGHAVIAPLRRLAYVISGRTNIPITSGGSDDYMAVTNLGGVTTCLEQNAVVVPTQIDQVGIQVVSTFQQLRQPIGVPANYPVNLQTYCRRGCVADFDGDGAVTPADIAAFINNWSASLGAGNFGGDYDCDTTVAPADIASFISDWSIALSGGC